MSIEQLRDEFACAALIGLLAGRQGSEEFDHFGAAVYAYLYADAMLRQRNAYCPACGQRYDTEKGFVVHQSGCTYGWTPDLPTGEGL